MEELRKSVLRFASAAATAVAEEGMQDTLLFERKDVLARDLRSVAIFNRRPDGAIERDHAWGAIRADAAGAERAALLAARVFRTGAPASAGGCVAVASRAADSPGPDAAVPGAVVYLEVEPLLDDPVEVSRASFLVIVGAGLVLLVVTWFIVDRVVARPLGEVTAGARRVAAGDYGTPVPQSGAQDEIQTVVSAFNSMMVEMGALQGRMRERTQQALLETRKTQDSLVIAQRLASTGRLAAGIAHEVNNPLAGMLNAVHSLRTKDMTPAKREEYLEIVEDGLRRIQVTVSKILQFTPHKVAPQPVDLADVVRPVLALARHRIEKEEVGVAVEPPAEPAVVFGDPYELQQALLNVVLNALDALAEAHREAPRIEIVTAIEGSEIRLRVRDNGTGMKEDDLPRAFDLFFTTKEPGKGTGLGLATAHKILIDHGGRVELRSRGPEGMDVEFVLPRLT
jgi:signal transduction histidine kinase